MALSHVEMNLTVDQAAANWFKEEVGLRPNAGICFKTKIYASSPINPGFGIAVEPLEPENPIASYQADNGLVFFIEENDEWFFKGYDLKVTLSEDNQEPYYQFFKDGQVIN